MSGTWIQFLFAWIGVGVAWIESISAWIGVGIAWIESISAWIELISVWIKNQREILIPNCFVNTSSNEKSP